MEQLNVEKLHLSKMKNSNRFVLINIHSKDSGKKIFFVFFGGAGIKMLTCVNKLFYCILKSISKQNLIYQQLIIIFAYN